MTKTSEDLQERRVKSHFDQYSAGWARLYTEHGASLDRMDLNLRAACARELLMQVARNGRQVDRPRVLDIGCGTGHVLGCLRGDDFDITAMDFSESMIRVASAAHPQIHFLIADARHLPFEPQTIDVVTMMGALEYIPDSSQVLTGIATVLRTDGWLILSFPNWRSLFRRAHAVERVLTWPLRRGLRRDSRESGSDPIPKAHYHHCQWSERSARKLLQSNGFAPEYVRYCTYGFKTPWLDGNRLNLTLGNWLGVRCSSIGFLAKNLAWTLVIAAKKLDSPRCRHHSS